jgi:hypothetical protein
MKTATNTTELLNIKKNILGTISIDLKIKGMRKSQSFIFYPINKSANVLLIQSNTRISKVNLDGKGHMSKSHASGAYLHHLSMDELTPFEFSKNDWSQIVDYIGLTESSEAGKQENGILQSDNSGAKSIFNL